jgi:hypothetical protein
MGTCAIDSLERMLQLPREEILDWFRDTGRNPSLLDDIVITLATTSVLLFAFEQPVSGPDTVLSPCPG